ncbi:Sec34-like family-domain-containing protein [Phycomyces blakesleeanus]|uniref:Conserved oligomeric Golgi complex subunit 3 n=1 Tax=Phycomyces blakesleeanus TaxID=4837 RepID=A0ABR3BCF4_PHYBL
MPFIPYNVKKQHLTATSTSPSLALNHSSGVRTPESFSSTPTLSPLNAGALSSRLSALSPRSRSAINLLAETTAADYAAEQRSAQEIGSNKPIETLQQFFDWFATRESEMEKDQEDIYRNYLSVVVLYREACDNFLEDLHGTLGVFGELGDEYAFVEQRTRALQTTCEELLQEQDRLTHLADALAERLAYFNHLEPIAKLFNSPGDDICLRPEFIGMLQTLDECIEYMQQHVSYRDSELYLMRFRQCMTRGMTLIKMYAVSTIKAVGYEMYKQMSPKTNDTSTNFGKQTNLFYVKFRAIAPTIKTLTGQLEKRCQGHKEYQALYQDILSAYFQTRQQLLSPVISRKIQQLGPSGGELVQFAQNGCAYMMTLCSDEFNLFYNMFPSGEEDLYAYLDELTSYLYDHLRPRIIHENRIETLSELCGIFQVYIMQDDYQTGDEREGGHRLMFGNLIRNVLEDAQGKLVFRAQSFIHQDIQSYHPKPEDFELSKSIDNTKGSVILDPVTPGQPELNAIAGTPATLNIEDDASDTHSKGSSVEASLLQMSELTDDTPHVTRRWYPALQNTLWILSKLYRCVQTGVFEDLAQEAVSLCSESLKRASDIITNTKSALDGQLFLIKHLLVLKEQLAPFEAELVHTGKELSFFPTTGALSSLQQNRSFFFNPNTLIGLAQSGMPRIVEISLDSRREVNFKLKDVCEEFITDCVSTAVDPLTVFMIKLSTMRPVGESSPDENGSPRAKTLSQEDVQSTVEQFKESAEERIRFVLRKLREYVNDYKMEQILIRPIELNILENYKNFYHTVTTESNGGKISTLDEPLPSVEYMSMWISQWKEEQSP